MERKKLLLGVLAVCGLLVGLLVIARGCGGGDDYDQWGGMSKEEWLKQRKARSAKEATVEKAKQEQAAELKAKQAAEAKKTARAAKEEKRKRLAAQKKTAVKKQQKPTHPKNFADWKPEDYLAAHRENDRALIRAVGYLGSQHPDKQLAAEVLVKLLEMSSEQAGAARRKGRNGNAAIISAVIAALVANDTPTAWKAIERLALGEQAAGAGDAVVLEAIEALMKRQSRDSEDVVFRVAKSVAESVPEEETAEKAKTRQSILKLVESSASEFLRVRLADYLVSPRTPRHAFEAIWSCLQKPCVENIMPQAIVYQGGRFGDGDNKEIEERLAVVAAGVLWRLSGMSDSAVREHSGDAPFLPASLAERLAWADRFWGTGFSETAERRLLMVDSLADSGNCLSLAGVIPRRSTRAALRRTLELHWEEKPDGLIKSGWGDEIVPEPGFLVVLKSLLSDNPLAADYRPADNRSAGTRSSRSKAAALREVRRRSDEIAYKWLEFSGKLTRAMCRQYRAAAGVGLVRSEDFDSQDLPLAPHPGAEIVATYGVSWPEDFALKDAPRQLAALSPLRVDYLRIEQRVNLNGVLRYYRRRLSKRQEQPIDQGLWIGSFDTSGDDSSACSIDVLITAPNVDHPAQMDQEQRLIVEILAVQCETGT